MEKRELLHCWWECKLIQPLWKTVWRFLKKLGIKPPYDPAILLLEIYPEETKTEKDTSIPLFTAPLFTTARTWKQPRCPSTWMDKEIVVNTQNGILLSHKNECLWVSSNEVDGPRTYYTEWSESENDKYHILTHILEKAMATHSSVLAWRIPGLGEPGGLPSMESHRVGHDWSNLAAAAAAYQSKLYHMPKLSSENLEINVKI